MTDQLTLFPEDTETANRLNTLSARIGIAPDRIKGVRLQLDVLRSQGVLVDLDISGISLFTRQASWFEQGVAEDDIRRDRLTRGQKYMIPQEQIKKLRSVESQMRQLLEDHSYRITGFAPYRWIPFTAYDQFRAEWAELSGRFDQVKAEIVDRYDHYTDLLAGDFAQVAAEAWRSFVGRAGDRTLQVNVEGMAFADLDAFTDYIVSAAVARMPSCERIERELYADYTTALVYGDQDFAADELAAERIRQQVQAEREQARHETQLLRLDEEEKRVKLEAMRQAEAEHARQRLQQMTDPFQEVFAELRRRIAEDAKTMLESIKKNSYLRGKVAEKGRGLLDIFDLLAAHNDYELRERLLRLKAAIGPVGQDRSEDAPDRDVDEIAGILHQVVDLSHAATQDLMTGPSRFSMLE